MFYTFFRPKGNLVLYIFKYNDSTFNTIKHPSLWEGLGGPF